MEKEMLYSEEVEPPGTLSEPGQRSDNLYISPSKHGIFPALPTRSKSPAPLDLKDYKVPRFQISRQALAFRRRFFPGATSAQWNDWRWQLANRVQDIHFLQRILRLSDDERSAIGAGDGLLPVAITPYYASLLDGNDPHHALRRTVVPSTCELLRSPGEAVDPLGEENDSPVPGLVHRYPDRVLFLVTNYCSTYCRYCTRSRELGNERHHSFNPDSWEKAIAYIESTPAIRDVLLSGGDPLTLPDEKLEWLLWRLRQIPHVEMLRIGSKVPAVLPQRITPALARILKRYHPLWISIHFTHPDEVTPETTQACERLANAGIPLGSQTVLLSGINDDAQTMKRLVHGLLRMRVRPYYLYQCDPIVGSAHFRTPVEKGLEVIKGLRGHTSGYAVPTYVIDAPGGGGKIPLLPQYLLGREGCDLVLRNYEGNVYRYPEPECDAAIKRAGNASMQREQERFHENSHYL